MRCNFLLFAFFFTHRSVRFSVIYKPPSHSVLNLSSLQKPVFRHPPYGRDNLYRNDDAPTPSPLPSLSLFEQASVRLFVISRSLLPAPSSIFPASINHIFPDYIHVVSSVAVTPPSATCRRPHSLLNPCSSFSLSRLLSPSLRPLIPDPTRLVHSPLHVPRFAVFFSFLISR